MRPIKSLLAVAAICTSVGLALLSPGHASAGTQTVCVDPPVNTSLPVISGDGLITHSQTVTVGGWDTQGVCSTTYLVQWFRNGSMFLQQSLGTATTTHYTLAAVDNYATITAKVQAKVTCCSSAWATASGSLFAHYPPPNPPNLSGPSGSLRAYAASYTFSSGSTGVDQYACSVNGGTYFTCSSPYAINWYPGSGQSIVTEAHTSGGWSSPSSTLTVSVISPDCFNFLPVATSPGQCVPQNVERSGGLSSATLPGNGSGDRSAYGVAIVDEGVSSTHPDLNVVLQDTSCASLAYASRFIHGTAVAGITGARDNAFGVVGVAPGVKIYDYQGKDQDNPPESKVACAVTLAANNPNVQVIEVIMSLAYGHSSSEACPGTTPLRIAICTAIANGKVVVSAAANNSMSFDVADNGAFPASYPDVLTVTGYYDNNGIENTKPTFYTSCQQKIDEVCLDYSDWAATAGGQAHTVAAPTGAGPLSGSGIDCSVGLGQAIWTTWRFSGSDGYGCMKGVSGAAPVVAGEVINCIATGACAGMTPAQIITKIRADAQARASVDPLLEFMGAPTNPFAGKYFGYAVWLGQY